MTSKAELLAEKARAYDEFVATIADLDDAQFALEPKGEEWTPKDVVAHVAFWEDFLSKMLLAWLIEAVPLPGFDSYDEINTYAVALSRPVEFSKILEDLETAHRDVLRIVTELVSDETLANDVPVAYETRTGHRPLSELLTDYIEHYSEHATQLRVML